jgi:fatty-acyl-CoA synthase
MSGFYRTGANPLVRNRASGWLLASAATQHRKALTRLLRRTKLSNRYHYVHGRRMTSFPMSPLMGQMMDQPLLISSIIEFAARHYGASEIVSRRVEGDMHRYTYRDCARRARRMAGVLGRLGVGMGDRVATLAWNGYRHMELYYAVSGSGAVLHTVNPRLHPDQLAYIIRHAENKVLFFDLSFLPLAEIIAARC